jgi:hypothetical protein
MIRYHRLPSHPGIFSVTLFQHTPLLDTRVKMRGVALTLLATSPPHKHPHPLSLYYLPLLPGKYVYIHFPFEYKKCLTFFADMV